jgi:hypothetical protein
LNDGLGADPNAIHPGTGSLTITGYAPTVTRTTASSYGVAHSYVTRGSQSVVSWLNDGLGVDPGAITPGTGSLAITGYAPTLVQTTNQAVAPGVGNLTITGYAPIVTRTANQSISPSVGNITITGHAPTLAQTANQALAPGTGSLTITGHAPTLVQTANQGVIPGTGSLAITGYAPVVAQAPGSYVVSAARANLIYEIALLHGLVPSNPLMVSDTLRSAGSVIQTISTVGTSVTITTVSSDVIQGDLDTWIDALAAVHGLTTPLVVTEASRNAGAIHQTMSNDGTTTTVETP